MGELHVESGTVMTGYLAGHRPHASVSPEECERIGGHCFESDGRVLTSNPPQYPETCKHCGKRRVGVPQPSVRYYNPDEGIRPLG
jgi:hypothetical protein